jgi:hypothetical protein
MKKTYLLSALLISSISVFAQKNTPVQIAKKNSGIYEKAPKGNFSQLKNTVWQNDFSTASQWTTVLNNLTIDAWVIGTSAPSGPYAIDPIASTTASNGYALFDSDLLCSGDQNADVRITTPIDLSANPSVKLEFESFYRNFQGNCYVIASTDGTNWTEFEVHSSVPVNGLTANPEVVQVNLSSVIGGSATAYIGFRYIGGCDYAWMVDDVKLATLDDYDLAIAGAYWGSTGFWGARLPYYQIPLAQLAPIDVAGIVTNNGALDQNDVMFTAALASEGWSGSSAPEAVLAGATDTISLTAALTPPPIVATHVINMSVSSGATDALPGDNAILNAASISVNDFIYARDKGTATSGTYNQGMGFEAGNIFDIYFAANLSGIDAYIGATAVVGAEVYAKLYSIDATTGDFIFVDESATYTLTAANLGQKITLALGAGAAPLSAGESYLVVLGSLGDNGATNDLVISTAGVSEDQTSFYYDWTDQLWYYTTSTPMVRMNFDPSVGINEVENNLGLRVFPNPANEVINISLNKDVSATITLLDVSGKVVRTQTLNGISTSINTASLNSGVYFVTINDGTSVSTQKVVIKK